MLAHSVKEGRAGTERAASALEPQGTGRRLAPAAPPHPPCPPFDPECPWRSPASVPPLAAGSRTGSPPLDPRVLGGRTVPLHPQGCA